MSWTKTIFTLQMPWKRSNFSLFLLQHCLCPQWSTGSELLEIICVRVVRASAPLRLRLGLIPHLCLIALIFSVGRGTPISWCCATKTQACQVILCMCVCAHMCRTSQKYQKKKDPLTNHILQHPQGSPDFSSVDFSSLCFRFSRGKRKPTKTPKNPA